MGRNIKFYNGSYISQTSSYWSSASTGYTVPTGKVARIGFDLAALSGNDGNTVARACGGFYAGTAGTTSTGSTSNRFLMVYTPGTEAGTMTEVPITVHFNPLSGHKWLSRKDDDRNPQMYIGDSQRERFTNRSSSNWYRNNIGLSFNNSSTSDWGTLGFYTGSNTTITAQRQLFTPSYQRTQNQNQTSANFTNGPVHAFAGETVYIWDWSQENYTSWNYRTFGKVQWSMFVVEEDA